MINDSEHTDRAKASLRIVSRTLLNLSPSDAAMLQEAIDMLIECKIIDALNGFSVSIEAKMAGKEP